MRENVRERYGRSLDDFQRGGMSATVFNNKVMPLFALGLLMTGLSSFFAWNMPSPILIGAMILEIILIFTSPMWAYKERGSLNIGIYLFFTSLSGASLVPLLKWAISINPTLILQAFGVTAFTFVGLMVYGAVTKKDYSWMGTMLFMSVIGLIIASIIGIFVGGSILSIGISFISVIVFSLFVIYDMSMIRNHFSERDYIVATIALYLDFILLFQNILQLLGMFSDD